MVPPKIKSILAEHLETGYIDGFGYSADEWELLEVLTKDNIYYCIIQINSSEFPTAVYEVTSDSDSEEIIHVGNSEEFDKYGLTPIFAFLPKTEE